jgi:predicted DNA-binding protein with PD1-like motif
MKWKTLSEGPHGRTAVLVFDTDDEVVETLASWCGEQDVTAARFTAIGALRDVTLGWFDWQAKEYRKIPVDEQVEVLTLAGDVAVNEGKPAVHAHVVVGDGQGDARGGHLLAGHVRPTLELVIDEPPAHLRKRHDPESGLALIAPDIDAGG